MTGKKMRKEKNAWNWRKKMLMRFCSLLPAWNFSRQSGLCFFHVVNLPCGDCLTEDGSGFAFTWWGSCIVTSLHVNFFDFDHQNVFGPQPKDSRPVFSNKPSNGSCGTITSWGVAWFWQTCSTLYLFFRTMTCFLKVANCFGFPSLRPSGMTPTIFGSDTEESLYLGCIVYQWI